MWTPGSFVSSEIMVPPFRPACRNMEIKPGWEELYRIVTEMDLSQADPERSNIAKRREFIRGRKKTSGGGCKDLRVSIWIWSDSESLWRSIHAVYMVMCQQRPQFSSGRSSTRVHLNPSHFPLRTSSRLVRQAQRICFARRHSREGRQRGASTITFAVGESDSLPLQDL